MNASPPDPWRQVAVDLLEAAHLVAPSGLAALVQAAAARSARR